MKIVKTGAFQGDVLLRFVGAMPKGFALRERTGPLIVAHSETGHHHAIDDSSVAHFEDPKNPLVCYLQLGDAGQCDVVHQRSWDTHETVRMLGKPGAVIEVRRQREHTPEGWRRVQD